MKKGFFRSFLFCIILGAVFCFLQFIALNGLILLIAAIGAVLFYFVDVEPRKLPLPIIGLELSICFLMIYFIPQEGTLRLSAYDHSWRLLIGISCCFLLAGVINRLKTQS